MRGVFQQVQLQLNTLLETCKQIEKSQMFLSEQFDSIKAELDVTRKEIGVLKRKTDTVVGDVAEWRPSMRRWFPGLSSSKWIRT